MNDSWSWASGLFEGEGSISIGPRGGRLSLGMKDRDVVERFAVVAGAGHVRMDKRPNPRHSDIWRWEVSAWGDRKRILEAMLPYLGERRSERALAMLATPPKAHWNTRKTHCKRGHPFSGANLAIGRTGIRRCRACCRLRQRKEYLVGSAT